MNNKIKVPDFFNDETMLYTFIQSKLLKHRNRIYKYTDNSSTDAAVLIPIFFKNNEPFLLFTKRTEFVAHHKGQISFPGGAYDKKDKNLQETALRETWEEMGINPEDITILGKTDQLLTNTQFLVTPFVGYFSYPYNFTINSAEIARVIEIPLQVLMDLNNFEIKIKKLNQISYNVHYYYYNNTIIWGVTGFLLSNFLSIIFDINH